MLKFALPAVLIVLPHVSSAFGFGSRFARFLDVNSISATNFEVMSGPDEGPRAYWCAAARHVENTLGLQQTRIYLAVGRGPSITEPGRKAVQFSTQPVGDNVSSYSISIRKVGYNLGSGHALRFCDDYYTYDND